MTAETSLPRCSLQEVGIDASGVKKFLKEIEAEGYHLHSFMITRHGKVAYECCWAPYRLEEEHLMHSFTKGLVASAVGILEGEGRISLDDPAITYFPEYRTADTEEKQAGITLEHLLTMTNGHAAVPDRHGCDDEIRAFFQEPVIHEPGTVFEYDSLGSHVLASIVKRVTGYNLFQFLQLRVFDAMGISGVSCDSCATGKDQGGGGGRLKTEDMAKLTILYLNGGVWNGQQLIPKDWIDRMTVTRFAGCKDKFNPDWEDWRCGYGYQVWMCQIPNTFRFDGLHGQFGVVLKDLDASIITTCGECYTEAVLRLMWKYLVPAVKRPEEIQNSAQKETEQWLEDQKEKLHILWPLEQELSGEQREAAEAELIGKYIIFGENRESVLPASRRNNCFTALWTEQHRTGIQNLRIRKEDEGYILDYEDNCNHGSLPLGMDESPARGLLRSLWGDYKVWTGARWRKDGCLEMQIRMVNGEYYQVFTICPKDGQAVVGIYSGPWDRRKGKPENAEYRCKLHPRSSVIR
ncbi:hypothetical protein C0033_23780 [Clostridium sp. chh4-2]|uniref:serine hydrolase domain-containing protein n=1 Tax=Clostridium sp. chh4-2 TaxID=2067550 RepID=UPI000CCF2464|nr:serine hydrolase [Clostridium sp. chh4-2]PNV59472.1 hypothetical protein C0033_23780 [Clostridium sp. chh4-2]